MASQDVEETVIQCGVQTSPHSKPILVLTASHAEAEGQTGLAKGCSSNDASTTAADAQPTQISHGCRGPHDRRSPRNRQSPSPKVKKCEAYAASLMLASAVSMKLATAALDIPPPDGRGRV